MGSQGSLGGIHGYLGWDTLGGPMGPWDRWDLGTDGTWASRTPDTSSEDTSSELFIDTRPGPAQPRIWGCPYLFELNFFFVFFRFFPVRPGCRARCRLPAAGPAAFTIREDRLRCWRVTVPYSVTWDIPNTRPILVVITLLESPLIKNPTLKQKPKPLDITQLTDGMRSC